MWMCTHTHVHCKSAKGLTVTEHVHAFTHNYPNYTGTLAGTSLSLQLGIYCLRRGALPLVVQREDRCAVCFGHTYNIPSKSQSRHTAICPHRSLNLPIENLTSCFTRELLTFSLACWRSSVFFVFFSRRAVLILQKSTTNHSHACVYPSLPCCAAAHGGRQLQLAKTG